MKKDKKTNIEKILEITMYILSTLVGIFMLLKITANIEWAFYVELALIPPLWSIIITLLIIYWKKEKEKKEQKHVE